MEDILTKGAIKEGFFALLFISLLVYQLKENKDNTKRAEERENKLLSFLNDMKEQFASLVRQYERLSDDVEDIKDKLDRRS